VKYLKYSFGSFFEEVFMKRVVIGGIAATSMVIAAYIAKRLRDAMDNTYPVGKHDIGINDMGNDFESFEIEVPKGEGFYIHLVRDDAE
jgi:hypothetical protein